LFFHSFIKEKKMFCHIFLTLIFSIWLAESSAIARSPFERASMVSVRQFGGGQGGNNGGNNGGGQDSCLKDNLIQSASAKTGQEPGTEGIKDGQAASAT
jgi:hypothetical protein